VLIDRFLEDAFEADVDALCDGETVVIGGVMQHIEEAGIHSGDSACVLPPYLLGDRQIEEMREHTRSFALELGVVGLINVQYAVFEGEVYVLEVNPRASRTVPFVSKATGRAAGADRRAADGGRAAGRLRPAGGDPGARRRRQGGRLPLQQDRGVDPLLGPEMRSTGEAMGIDDSFGMAFAKAQVSAGHGAAARRHRDHHRQRARQADGDADRAAAARHGLPHHGDRGHGPLPRARGVPCDRVFKVNEGRPNMVDRIISARSRC
jgi:carbamoyl-phosphate synthase large subunit